MNTGDKRNYPSLPGEFNPYILECCECDKVFDHPSPYPNVNGCEICPHCGTVNHYTGYSEY